MKKILWLTGLVALVAFLGCGEKVLYMQDFENIASGDMENGNVAPDPAVGTTTNRIHGDVIGGGYGGGKALASKPADASKEIITLETYPLVPFTDDTYVSAMIYTENVDTVTIMFHSPTIGDNNRYPITNLTPGEWQAVEFCVLELIRYEPPDAKTMAEVTVVAAGPFSGKKGRGGKPFHVNTCNLNFKITDKGKPYKVLIDDIKIYR